MADIVVHGTPPAVLNTQSPRLKSESPFRKGTTSRESQTITAPLTLSLFYLRLGSLSRSKGILIDGVLASIPGILKWQPLPFEVQEWQPLSNARHSARRG